MDRGLGADGGIAVALVVALLRGLRHATDPDAQRRGLVHGIGGSAGAGILLVGAIDDDASAAVALAIFAVATAAAMGLTTLAFGHVLSRDRIAVRLESTVPVLGVLGMLFGAWYVLGSVEAVPYVF